MLQAILNSHVGFAIRYLSYWDVGRERLRKYAALRAWIGMTVILYI